MPKGLIAGTYDGKVRLFSCSRSAQFALILALTHHTFASSTNYGSFTLLLSYYHQLIRLSIAGIQELQAKGLADYLVAFPKKHLPKSCEARSGEEWLLDGTPTNAEDPEEGDCLGPFVQRVLGAANAGASSVPIKQKLNQHNVEFCWDTATDLGNGRYRMYLRTTKAIQAKQRLELLTTYGPAHIINTPAGKKKK